MSNNSDNTSLAVADTLGGLEGGAPNLELEDPNTREVLLAKDSLSSLISSTLSSISRNPNTKEGSSISSNSFFFPNYSILSTILSSTFTTLDVYNGKRSVGKDYIVKR